MLVITNHKVQLNLISFALKSKYWTSEHFVKTVLNDFSSSHDLASLEKSPCLTHAYVSVHHLREYKRIHHNSVVNVAVCVQRVVKTNSDE